MTSEIPGASGAKDYSAGTVFGQVEAAAQRERYGTQEFDYDQITVTMINQGKLKVRGHENDEPFAISAGTGQILWMRRAPRGTETSHAEIAK